MELARLLPANFFRASSADGSSDQKSVDDDVMECVGPSTHVRILTAKVSR